mmetsp:Transcript_11619/g.29848  ORF Transcript_11619/g.29848 Transcript_11619/m.29848 type:complete len:280 (-) Transcript_11619:177-1016(-)
MIWVLSNMSRPGPTAEHCSVRLLHVEWSKSHGSPVSRQCGPRMFGETSPRFVDPKAATKGPAPGGAPAAVSPFIARSIMYEAYPLLSPLTSLFVLFIEVGCTANHANMPRDLLAAVPSAESTRSTVMFRSVSPVYSARSAGGLRRYADGLRLIDAFSSSPTATDARAGARLRWAATTDSTTPSTIAAIVCGCHPDPANWKMVSCRKPDGPECVCVPEMATFSSVYSPGRRSASPLTTRFLRTIPPIPASRETSAKRFPVAGSCAASVRAHSRWCSPAFT